MSKFDELARLNAIYIDLESRDGWKDIIRRIKSMREGMALEILAGSLDKFGNDRSDEKRAVLVTLDRLLTWIPSVRQQFEKFDKIRNENEAKMKNARSNLHSGDF